MSFPRPTIPAPGGRRARVAGGAVALAAIVTAAAVSGCGSSGGSDATAGHADPAASPLRPPAAISLDNGWRFYADPRNLGMREDWSAGPRQSAGATPATGTGSGATPVTRMRSGGTPVTIPNDFNPIVVRAADAGGVGWYTLRFTGPPAVAGRSWNVHFDGVRRTADVWLNGRKLGTNSDPYAPFSLRATSLRPERPEPARRAGRQRRRPPLVPSGLVELGRDRPRCLAGAHGPSRAFGPRRDAGAGLPRSLRAPARAGDDPQRLAGRSAWQGRGPGHLARRGDLDRARQGARPATRRLHSDQLPGARPRSPPAVVAHRPGAVSRAGGDHRRPARGAGQLAARGASHHRRPPRDPVPQRAPAVAARRGDPRGRDRARGRARRGRRQHDRLATALGRGQHHAGALPPERQPARRAGRRRDPGVVSASRRSRRCQARPRRRSPARPVDAAGDDHRRAQPSVGDRRLGRQRALAGAELDAGDACLPAPGDPAGATA